MPRVRQSRSGTHPEGERCRSSFHLCVSRQFSDGWRGSAPSGSRSLRPQGEVPTQTKFLEKVENTTRDRLLAQAKETVIGLPPLILQTADRKAAEADNDGAAELYMLYLNSTAGQSTSERKRAQKFLLDNYNFRAYGESPKS